MQIGAISNIPEQVINNIVNSTSKVQKEVAMKMLNEVKSQYGKQALELIQALNQPLNTTPKSLNSTFEKIM
ncbi:MAG TPA: hypothetical protein PLI27_06165 [Ignavibacteriales bacterium]|mgnify:CR=1 FL=1|nr:hypothetical protein [Ignavibacteriales bacterium]HOL80860.1 hypothetical protein [Ignavibacteriales bacterium]HOM65886.1 hypothetical protein [Ignavibacteriales bacterium]HPD67642.1 hypothetical protein [Ignavibacteriales bacterium]HPP33295.1 hypothetical protein [Ignavibacteriales bacterium]